MWWYIIFIVFLVICDVICFGATYALITTLDPNGVKINRKKVWLISFIVGLSGPIGLIACYTETKFKYGLKFR